MGRKKGTPAYSGKTRASSFITTPQAMRKLKGAERRSGKSRSDCLTRCIVAHADTIDSTTFAPQA